MRCFEDSSSMRSAWSISTPNPKSMQKSATLTNVSTIFKDFFFWNIEKRSVLGFSTSATNQALEIDQKLSVLELQYPRKKYTFLAIWAPLRVNLLSRGQLFIDNRLFVIVRFTEYGILILSFCKTVYTPKKKSETGAKSSKSHRANKYSMWTKQEV